MLRKFIQNFIKKTNLNCFREIKIGFILAKFSKIFIAAQLSPMIKRKEKLTHFESSEEFPRKKFFRKYNSSHI